MGLANRRRLEDKLTEDIGTSKNIPSAYNDFSTCSRVSKGLINDLASKSKLRKNGRFHKKKLTSCTSMKAQISDLLQLAIIKRQRKTTQRLEKVDAPTPKFRAY
uniref:Uncharacterized protein n=1 Tax=Euplotes crassus TaxID=5936 RepID=A0A7S3KFV4_EUPCR|mmetsp:Transcript_25481/g.25266  ORF Transcript_25481/g.25266 Transcript_25481/m.25266 type:complete len:104 (+) Transcript_25481:182-493(+)